MSNGSSQDLDVFGFLKALWSYLKTEKEPGEVSTNERNERFTSLRITIRNTAPNDLQKPLVVFTGVRLRLTRGGGKATAEPMWAHSGGSRKHYELEHQPADNAWFSITGKSVGNFPDFPKVTDDEKRQGHVLFPGESLTYRFLVPANDMQNYGFQVEGNVSRRHLFHFKEVL